MSDGVHRYEGRRLVVFWDEKRCLHAGRCVQGSAAAFDPARRPWVDPDAVPSRLLAEVIQSCPTGALWYQSKTPDGPSEAPPPHTVVTVVPDGPLYVHGPVTIEGVTPRGPGTRVALCRCGQSKNKPLCDGAHTEAGFKDPGLFEGEEIHEAEAGPCKITVMPDGPLILRGWVEVREEGAEGDHRRVFDQVSLCRCGASKNKPFCDGGHNKIDFRG